MEIIRYSTKFYIINIILDMFGLAFSIIALFFLNESVHWLVWVMYCIILLASAIGSFFVLWEMQWIKIDTNTIYACNIFGVIKSLDISKIQSVKITNAKAWGIKMYAKHYSCIVISTRKAMKLSDVQDAYNHKKQSYVIFPNTCDNQQILKKAYINATGKELEIE